MGNQHFPHRTLAERDAELQDVFGVAADEGGLAGVESRGKDQFVEVVTLYLTLERLSESLLETCSVSIDIDFGCRLEVELKVLDPEQVAVSLLIGNAL